MGCPLTIACDVVTSTNADLGMTVVFVSSLTPLLSRTFSQCVYSKVNRSAWVSGMCEINAPGPRRWRSHRQGLR